MALRRACSYEATIKTPVAPSNYSAILVTFQQGGVNLVEKTLQDLTLTATSIIVKLTQEETALFEAKKKAYLQVRCYASTYDAPGSAVWDIPVEAALNDEVLP
jgi:hypothetical protein